MTRLNLNDIYTTALPPVAAGEEMPWSVKIETRTRSELIHLAIFLARALNSEFLYDMEDPPIVIVPGSAPGKSMVVEAMMKTLLDQTDPLKMLKWYTGREMFIEKRPIQARYEYCYAAGTHRDTPILCGFDRVSPEQKSALTDTFKTAAAEVTPAPAGGIIFSSNTSSRPKSGQWLTLQLNTDPDTWPQPKGWARTSAITVQNERLKADPQFRRYWSRLQDVARTGDLTPLTGSKLRPPHLPALRNPIL